MHVVALSYILRAAPSLGSAATFLAAARTASVFFFQPSLVPLGGVFLPSSVYSSTSFFSSSWPARPARALLRSEFGPPLWAFSMISAILYFGLSLSWATSRPVRTAAAARKAAQTVF